jgi:hypothetical protein
MATIATQLLVGPNDHGCSMTLEEFLEADVVEGYRYELARGALEVTQVPNDPHRQVVTNLYDAIGRYRRMRPGVVLSYGGGSEFPKHEDVKDLLSLFVNEVYFGLRPSSV